MVVIEGLYYIGTKKINLLHILYCKYEYICLYIYIYTHIGFDMLL